MAPTVAALPARYAKFLTAVIGQGIAYVQLYGTTWHLNAFLVMAGAALAVLGVPNAPKGPAMVYAGPLPPSVTRTNMPPLPPATGNQI